MLRGYGKYFPWMRNTATTATNAYNWRKNNNSNKRKNCRKNKKYLFYRGRAKMNGYGKGGYGNGFGYPPYQNQHSYGCRRL